MPCDHCEVVHVGDEGTPRHNDKAYKEVGLGKPIHDPGGPVPLLVLKQTARTQRNNEACKGQGNHVIWNLNVGKCNHLLLDFFLNYTN